MSTNYDADARLRAIALNSVREAMLVYGRWDRPFTDDDAARVENIYQILHLAALNSEYEHAPLVAEQQPAVSPTVRKIADILGDLPSFAEPADSIAETSAIKANLPKTTLKAVSE